MTKSNRQITFLSAGENQTLDFQINRKENLTAKTVEQVADILVKFDKGGYYFSSSMEFAKEYGFKRNDGAMALYNKGYKLAVKQIREGA